MKLWGGRFTKETNQLVHNFNASIGFDQKFYHQDIRGSIAHVTMLAKQGILTDAERDTIIAGLSGIEKDIENGTLVIDGTQEDIHSFVEANLIARVGEVGKKLHTGRSRNDQVALDMKLYIRDEIAAVDELLVSLLEELHTLMKNNVTTYMPGFTHLQKAQPITLAHHMGAYFEMFKRDRSRIADIIKRMNTSPIGSGGLAGTTYPLDREYTASLLNFDCATLNSMDSVADRDYLIEMLSAFSTIMMHLSRFCEEFIIWNSNEYRFIELDDAYSTGSSIMPQKKNPDIAELVCDAVNKNECENGILICGTGIGVSIAANKVKGIRAVVCSEPYSAKMSRLHNNANILSLGSRVVGNELAILIVDTWLKSDYEGGRHQKRLDIIKSIEDEMHDVLSSETN